MAVLLGGKWQCTEVLPQAAAALYLGRAAHGNEESWSSQPTLGGAWWAMGAAAWAAVLLQFAFSGTLLSSTGSTSGVLLADSHCS